jgi:hypothetical protein
MHDDRIGLVVFYVYKQGQTFEVSAMAEGSWAQF